VRFYYEVCMTIDFTKPILFDAANNGYMVTLDNGWPYEVLSGDPLMPSILTWMNGQGNTVQPYVPPTSVKLDPDVQLSSEIIQDYIDSQKQTKRWQDRKVEILKAGDA
jgi:hypothetical protein